MSDEQPGIADAFAPVAYGEWHARVEQELGGGAFDALVSRSLDGLAIEPLYAPGHPPPPAHLPAYPGLSPHVRGLTPLGHVRDGFLVGQEHEHPALDACNGELRDDLAHGVALSWMRLGPAQGTRVWSGGDMARLFDGIDLGSAPVVLDAAADALPVAATFLAVAERRRIAPDRLQGGLGADPLGVLARTGSLPAGVHAAFREMADLAAFAAEGLPNMRAVLVDTGAYHRTGATAAQEVGAAAATGIEYVRCLLDAGFTVDDAARQVLFAFEVAGDFFVQVGKLRAARLVWSKVVAALGGSDEAAAAPIHARTSGRTKTTRAPWVNAVRATAETLAAIVGGADSVATSRIDEAVGPSDALTLRLARDTQLILRDEAHAHRVVDPAGGSDYVEALTDRIARDAWEQMRLIERDGGMTRSLLRGRFAARVVESRAARNDAVRHRRAPIVGVSVFADPAESRLERRIPLAGDVLEGLGRNLVDLDTARLREELVALLEASEAVAGAKGSLTRAAMAAAGAGADLHAIALALRRGRPSVHCEPLPGMRDAAEWETLRNASDAFSGARHRRPRAFIASFGELGEHKARTDWVAGIFSAGGIDPLTSEGYADVDAAVAAFEAAGAEMAVLSAPDARYAELAPALAERLKDEGARMVVVAGRPGAAEDELFAAGVDAFLYEGCDVLAVLSDVHRSLGVRR